MIIQAVFYSQVAKNNEIKVCFVQKLQEPKLLGKKSRNFRVKYRIIWVKIVILPIVIVLARPQKAKRLKNYKNSNSNRKNEKIQN